MTPYRRHSAPQHGNFKMRLFIAAMLVIVSVVSYYSTGDITYAFDMDLEICYYQRESPLFF